MNSPSSIACSRSAAASAAWAGLITLTSSARLRRRREQRAQQHDAVVATEDGVAGPLGVRHQPDDVAGLVADAGDVVEAAVRVLHVADDDAVVGPELGQRLGVAHVVALEVVDRDAQHVAGARRAREHRRVRLDPSSTVWQRNVRPAFFCSAPGSSPASVSTWKPLQMPTTGPPAAANSATASITGENRAIAPVRR